MPEYVEMTAWSLDEVRAHLRRVLPSGWKFEQGEAEEFLWAQILDENGGAIWDHVHMDERLLLLDAFCWLYFRPQPKPENSVWSERRAELTRRGVMQKVLESVPDPEDLNPEEVRSVYGLDRKKRR